MNQNAATILTLEVNMIASMNGTQLRTLASSLEQNGQPLLAAQAVFPGSNFSSSPKAKARLQLNAEITAALNNVPLEKLTTNIRKLAEDRM